MVGTCDELDGVAGPTLHVMRYEDMLANPWKSFSGLVKFLGLAAPRPRIEKAIRLSSFRVLKEQEQRGGFRERPAPHGSLLREGKAGQWRKILTPAQVSAIVTAHREQMTRFGYVPPGFSGFLGTRRGALSPARRARWLWVDPTQSLDRSLII